MSYKSLKIYTLNIQFPMWKFDYSLKTLQPTDFCELVLPFIARQCAIKDIAILSVRLSVCPSVRDVPVLDNGLTYCHKFFHHTVAQSF